MHQLDQIAAMVTGLEGKLPAMLLDSFGGAQEPNDGILSLGPLVRCALGNFAAGVDTQCLVLT